MSLASLDQVIGLSPEDAASLGARRANWVRIFRFVQGAGQAFRSLTDEMLKGDGLTAQQATLLTVVRSLGKPTMSEAARAMLVSHQNVKQLALPLVDKGFLRIVTSKHDRRERRLETTKKNERYWEGRDPHDLAWLAPCFDALGDEGCEQLVARLVELQQGIGRARQARAAGLPPPEPPPQEPPPPGPPTPTAPRRRVTRR